MPKDIPLDKLICMNDLAELCNYRVELAYAREDNLLFGERIYRKDAKLWLYKDLADIVCCAAKTCYEEHGLRFVLYDGLRPIEAQEAMMRTKRALENPHWMEEPLMLSKPGGGGHPRGMAIDVGLENLDMGCPFDSMTDTAHRDYPHTEEIKKNRSILDNAMLSAAETLGIELFPLPEEWWDFRLAPSFYNEFSPLPERILSNPMKMML